MKKNTFLTKVVGLTFSILVSIPMFAQTTNAFENTQKKLVGVWRQTGTMDGNGGIVDYAPGFYRITNPDNTFVMFMNTNNAKPNAAFFQSGTYKLLSDTSSVEQIIKHYNGENDRTVQIRFKFIDENTMISSWTQGLGRVWFSERWERIITPKTSIDAKEFKGLNIATIDQAPAGRIR